MNKNKLFSMTCGGELKKEQKVTKSWWLRSKVAHLVNLNYDFRMRCDPVLMF